MGNIFKRINHYINPPLYIRRETSTLAEPQPIRENIIARREVMIEEPPLIRENIIARREVISHDSIDSIKEQIRRLTKQLIEANYLNYSEERMFERMDEYMIQNVTMYLYMYRNMSIRIEGRVERIITPIIYLHKLVKLCNFDMIELLYQNTDIYTIVLDSTDINYIDYIPTVTKEKLMSYLLFYLNDMMSDLNLSIQLNPLFNMPFIGKDMMNMEINPITYYSLYRYIQTLKTKHKHTMKRLTDVLGEYGLQDVVKYDLIKYLDYGIVNNRDLIGVRSIDNRFN